MARSGRAYVYKKNATGDWTLIQDIPSYIPVEDGYFGSHMEYFNGFLFITANGQGRVFIYKFNESTQQFEYLQHLGGGSGFGSDLDVEGNTLVIGAYQGPSTLNGVTHFSCGSMYIYRLNQNNMWQFVANTSHPERDNYDWFGISVGIENGKIIAGASGENLDFAGANDLADAGAMYVFHDANALDTPLYNPLKIKAYPNPVTDWLTMEFDPLTEMPSVQVYDILGKLITVPTKVEGPILKLSFASLPNGMYILKAGNQSVKVVK